MDEKPHRTEDFDTSSAPMAAAARALFEIDPAGSCRTLGIDVTGTPEILREPIPPITLPGDILLVRVGPRRLAHIVHVLAPGPELEATMILYQEAIERTYPDHQLSHYAIVLGTDME